MDYEFEDLEKHNDAASQPNEVAEHESFGEGKEMRSVTGGQVRALVYGIQHVSDVPAINEFIKNCKQGFENAVEDAKDALDEFISKVTEGIKEYSCGEHESVPEFLSHETSGVDEGIKEEREFGLDECTEAAWEIFNPGVIDKWGEMSVEEKKDIACAYADRVAQAFELENYEGLYIERLDDGTLGSNNGDGKIYLSDSLLGKFNTPFLILDTITHEMRHQYQHECIQGYHNVPDEVRNEWAVAEALYNYDVPTCYDPWGYKYNPLEIDSDFAAKTIVRNVTSRIFNDAINLNA